MSTLIFMMLRLHTGSISGNTTQTQLRIQERESYTNVWTLDILLEIHTGGHTDGYTVGQTIRWRHRQTINQSTLLLKTKDFHHGCYTGRSVCWNNCMSQMKCLKLCSLREDISPLRHTSHRTNSTEKLLKRNILHN